jgi:hypothetical protein
LLAFALGARLDVAMEDDLERVDEARKQRAGVRAACERLEHAAASPSSAREREWCGVFATRLSELGSAFRRHVEVTEAGDGLFAEIIERAPRLTHRTQELQRDHRDIEDTIEGASATLAAVPSPDHATVEAARTAALDLLTRISRHRHLGAELVYDAYNVDIEAAD